MSNFGPLFGNTVDPTPDAVTVADEGLAQGIAATLNFVGDGVSASVVGNQATITIPGSTAVDTGAPLIVASGTTFVVPLNKQVLYETVIDCEGVIDLDGILSEVT